MWYYNSPMSLLKNLSSKLRYFPKKKNYQKASKYSKNPVKDERKKVQNLVEHILLLI